MPAAQPVQGALTRVLRSPALDALPGEALLPPKHVAALTGFAVVTLRLWARTGRKGPRLTRVEGYPRYRVSDVRDWLAEGGRAAPASDIFA